MDDGKKNLISLLVATILVATVGYVSGIPHEDHGTEFDKMHY